MSVLPSGAETVDRDSALTLLLIEDSPADSVLALLGDELPGTRVTTCGTMQDARRLLSEHSYDAVIADLSLPDAEGLTVVDAVRAADRAGALLVLTGREDSSLVLTALSRGAQDYLVKGRPDGSRVATAVLHAVQRQRSERAAHAYLHLAQGLLDALEAPACAVDADSRIIAVNEAWRAFTVSGGGQESTCGEGVSYLSVCDRTADGTPDALVSRTVATGLRDVLSGRIQRFQSEYPCHSSREKRWFSVRMSPAEIHQSRGAVIMHVDVTDMRVAQDALTHQALHDALTGLPNRLLLTDRLRQALSDSGRRGTDIAVAFVDLDHFKRVNDSFGHPVGDALLVQVAARLEREIRAGDTLARFSGDEFVVIWRDLTDPAEATLLSERLADAMAAPYEVGSGSITVTASVGVAVGRSPQSPEELLLAADAAMYDAKGHGRDRVRVFSAELRQDAEERRATEVGLRDALAAEQLVVHYQPVMDLATGRAVAVEALVRWEHPERGLLGPDRFIPVAESSGLIVPLGCWVLQRACLDAASWTGDLARLDVAVNLSVRQLTQPDVLRHVRDALSLSGLDPRRLLLEVTESAVMEDAEAAGVALDALAGLGVRIAIDDFGTGYSSLLYLRQYPISALKVDRAFVSGLGIAADDDAICSSVISLAHAVSATSIAEGVETPEQYAALRALGCQQAQGYLWSRAVPAGELEQALAQADRVPTPAVLPVRRSRRRAPAPRLDPEVAERIGLLHKAGASLHTIAAALNRESASNPAGVRWHAHAVARHVPLSTAERLAQR